MKIEELFTQYDNNITFNVRLIGGKKAFSLKSLKTIGDYANRNKVADVYFRPEGHQFVMLDLDGDQLGLGLGNLGAKPGDRLIKLISPNVSYLPKFPNFGDLRMRVVRA